MQYVTLPFGKISLPKQQLPFFLGLGALAALEVIEWPVAVCIGAGHLIAEQTHRKSLQEFGQALSSV
jgi:hypothetical protein